MADQTSGGDEAAGAAATSPGGDGAARVDLFREPLGTIASFDRNVIGAYQLTRVGPALDAMAAEVFSQFRALVDGASSIYVQAFLFKAVAAGCALADITWLSEQIADKALDWLLDNCTLADPRMVGDGVKQQYSHTCGVTTVEAIRGDYDPVYALRLRQANADIHAVDDDDATRINPALAADQKAMIETPYVGATAAAHSGRAADRDKLAAGAGRWVNDWLDGLGGVTGLVFDTLKDPPADTVVVVLTDKVGAGMQTPTVIGNGVAQYTHYILCMNLRGAAPSGVEFQFHDPWLGATLWRSSGAVATGALQIAGLNLVTALEVPAVKPR